MTEWQGQLLSCPRRLKRRVLPRGRPLPIVANCMPHSHTEGKRGLPSTISHHLDRGEVESWGYWVRERRQLPGNSAQPSSGTSDPTLQLRPTSVTFDCLRPNITLLLVSIICHSLAFNKYPLTSVVDSICDPPTIWSSIIHYQRPHCDVHRK